MWGDWGCRVSCSFNSGGSSPACSGGGDEGANVCQSCAATRPRVTLSHPIKLHPPKLVCVNHHGTCRLKLNDWERNFNSTKRWRTQDRFQSFFWFPQRLQILSRSYWFGFVDLVDWFASGRTHLHSLLPHLRLHALQRRWRTHLYMMHWSMHRCMLMFL